MAMIIDKENMSSYYHGVFYPIGEDGGEFPDPEKIRGGCFAPEGQPDNYVGYLFSYIYLIEDYLFYK